MDTALPDYSRLTKPAVIKIIKSRLAVYLLVGLNEPISETHLTNQSLSFDKLVSFRDKEDVKSTN